MSIINTQNHLTDLHFTRLTSPSDWLKLGQFRKKTYLMRKPYMLKELNDDGLDSFDNHGITYAAWVKKNIVASIRLCPYPFETENFLPEEKLHTFLGENYQSKYLEWTRLLIDPEIKLPHLLYNLLEYALIQTAAISKMPQYFGYSTPVIKRLFSRFHMSNSTLEFKIPHRGEQHYLLLKGYFTDALNSLKRQKEYYE